MPGLSRRIIRMGQQWAQREVSLASNGMELKASLVNRVTVIAVVALVLFASTVAKRPL